MARTFGSMFSRMRGVVAGFSMAQRTIALIGIAVLVLGVIGLTAWFTKPSYTPLFSGLSAEDASAIVEQLRTDNVSYQLTNGGSTVLVPEANVYEERLSAASAGLPSATSGGYSLLDEMGVTSSEFQQSVTYKRALEGELASTVSAISGVKTASVKLAIPEETVFVSEAQAPTASVFIEAESGVTLSTDQVNAIVHLTSASIEGMKATDVAVIDASGAVLSAVGTGLGGSGDSQAADYEERVKATVQAMLDRIVGTGNATVAVAATVSNESADVVSESFTNAVDVPALSESTQVEDYTGTGDAAAGVLGTDTAAGDTTGGDGTYRSESTVRDNAVNKVTETRTVPAGAIARQTISVAVNATVGVNPDEITQLVNAAAGVDAARGDAVAVQIVEFNSAAAEEAAAAIAAEKEALEAERTAALLRTAIIALGVAIPALIALVLFLRRSRQHREPVEIDEVFAPLVDDDQTVAFTAVLQAPTPEASDMDIRKADIARLAAQDPQKTADYLRGLMDERRPV
jgi:flagellar M-ring protein FliF